MTRRDLFVAVADLDAENAMKTLLVDRQRALGIQLSFNPDRPPNGDLFRYNGRDSGCYKDAVDILRPAQQSHRHALLIFDKHGSGVESKSRVEIEIEVEQRLADSGWAAERAAVVVIDPELEAWVWAESPIVGEILGWQGDLNGLRPFLTLKNLWSTEQPKPHDPKTAMRQALREKNKPLGARLFADLAGRVGLQRCRDDAFVKLRQYLTKWFSTIGNDQTEQSTTNS